MNYIHRITAERRDAQKAMDEAREMLIDIECYLLSAKFSAHDADYVHVRTDILPKIAAVRFKLIDG